MIPTWITTNTGRNLHK